MAKTAWEAEHGPDYEVPGLIDFMVSKGIFTDDSWHNDACPRFQVPSKKKQRGEPYGLTLWVEHPLCYSRDSGNKRFFVTEGQFISDSDSEFETDDLCEALTWIYERIGKYIPGRIPGIEELAEGWVQSKR